MARGNLLKLVKHINMLNPFPTEDSPEYQFLDPLISDEEIEVLLHMKLRKKYSIKELAKRCQKNYSEMVKLMAAMEQTGFVETHDTNEGKIYKIQVFAPGMFELLAMKRQDMDEYPHMGKQFDRYIMGMGKYFSLFPTGTGLMRVLPVQKAIKDNSRTADFEEVDFWLDKYKDHLAVGNCQCRTLRRQNGTATGHLEGEWCISLGDFAEQVIKTGKARRIEVEEARAIIQKAEEMGYVHQVSNIDGPRESVFICNCCSDVCLALKTSTLFSASNFSRSNYVSKIDKEVCVACGGCVEVCPTNAIKLGRKICEKNPVEIKKPISNIDHRWGKDQWNMDFLTTRENVIPETGTAPCKSECPAHISVQGYIKLASQGKYRTALELIKKENPLPAVCGRICPHNCESACTRREVDAPVAIDDIKKFVAEQELKAETKYVPKKIFNEGKKIAVIGSGPAGISCAYYLAVHGHEVTVFEKESKLGGMLYLGIPSYRLDKKVVEAEINVLLELGVKFVTNCEIGKTKTISELRKEGYQGFYIAIGAQGGRKLKIEGENHQDVIAGVDYLKKVNSGENVRTEGNVVVIGGGNVAIDVARTSIRTGAGVCQMYALEAAGEMPAQDEEIKEAFEEGIVINNGWGPKRIVVEDGKLKGIEFVRCLQVKDGDGRFNPQFNENEVIFVKADKILLSIGQSIEWNELLKGEKAEINPNGTLKADAFTYQTKTEDIFTGGDVYSGPRFAIDAIAAGKQGAISMHRYVWKGHDLRLGRDRRIYKSLDKNNLILDGYDQTPRQRPIVMGEYEKTFHDPRGILTEQQIAVETSRCLKCGAAYVDETKCIGCGVCTVQCKFDAIALDKVRNGIGVTYEQLPFEIGKYAIKREVVIATRIMKDSVRKTK